MDKREFCDICNTTSVRRESKLSSWRPWLVGSSLLYTQHKLFFHFYFVAFVRPWNVEGGVGDKLKQPVAGVLCNVWVCP